MFSSKDKRNLQYFRRIQRGRQRAVRIRISIKADHPVNIERSQWPPRAQWIYRKSEISFVGMDQF